MLLERMMQPHIKTLHHRKMIFFLEVLHVSDGKPSHDIPYTSNSKCGVQNATHAMNEHHTSETGPDT